LGDRGRGGKFESLVDGIARDTRGRNARKLTRTKKYILTIPDSRS
jgi:hypothetical protein